MVSVRASRDGTCTRSKAQTEEVFARCSKGLRVSAFNARSGPVPLPPGVPGVVGGERGGDALISVGGCRWKRTFRWSL